MSKFRDWSAEQGSEHDLPIPRDVTPNSHWPASMREMADHIGAYATMLIVEKFGGMPLYIPVNTELCATLTLIGAEKTRILCEVYHREPMAIPVASAAVRAAKIGGVISAVREKRLTLTEAVMALRRAGIRTSTNMVWRTAQAGEAEAFVPWEPKRRNHDPNQSTIFELIGE